MKRREFIAGLGGAAASSAPWPLSAHAQQSSKVYRVAWVALSTPVAEMNESRGIRAFRAFLEELRRLGYVEGRNLILERYSGEGRTEHYGDLANEVVRTKPDLIFTVTAIATQLKSATTPTVAMTSDPVASGFATSLAHPGGNITGVTSNGGLEIWGKRIQLLKETVRGLSRLGFLSPRGRGEGQDEAAAREAGRQMGISLVGIPLGGILREAEYRRIFAAMSQDRLDALIVGNAEENLTNRRVIVELAEKARLPSIYTWREYVELGGLMAYASDASEMWRQGAQQVDRILKGAKPQDTPFYQVTKFELILNLKTAKALGLTFPPSLAPDEVIE